MSRDDWFRNNTWSEAIEEAFFAKLKRARDKRQYLRIQASLLTRKEPKVALRLLSQYFEMGEHFDRAQAHVDRANAHLELGRVENALSSLESALEREAVYPRLRTDAYLMLPFLIATHSIEGQYDRALALLNQHKARLMFSVDHFRWHAANALILASRKDKERAKVHAVAAMQWAAKDNSGFRYHPTVGIVGDKFGSVQSELGSLAA